MGSPSLAEVADILREIAPPELAAEWDNVGMLLQPKPRPGRVARVLLTIDLTDAVAAEAVKVRADLVVCYHPPIFQPLQKLSAEPGRHGALLALAAAGIAAWSSHTALDAAPSGLGDWLADCVLGGEPPKELRPCGDGDFGRVVVLKKPLPFTTLLQRCKRKFAVRTLQVARPAQAPSRVRAIAVAAGAGGSVLRAADADVLVTGEMSHHDVLAALSAGRSVVLAGHANTERGFLKVLQRRLRSAFDGELDVRIAASDRDPITVA